MEYHGAGITEGGKGTFREGVNPVTFNDGFERVMAEYPSKEMIAVFDGWQTAPLFDYVTTFEHEQSLLKVSDIEALEELKLPFNTFRISISETAVPWKTGEHWIGYGTYRTNIIMTKHRGELWLLTEIKELWDRDAKTPKIVLPLYQLITNLSHDPNGKAEGAYFYKNSLWAHGRWQKLSKLDQEDHGIKQLVSGTMGALAAFLFDANMPSTHVVEVRPDKPNKSIQWVKARTHFTLITHGHPANQRTVGEGQRVRVDRNEEMKRMAHNRRGHWRTYRHERYRYALGSRRWVKAAWCGPKEWRDEGGRQIYKILEPVDGGQ